MDKNSKLYYLTLMGNRWLATRIEFLGNFVVVRFYQIAIEFGKNIFFATKLSIAVAAVAAGGSISPGLAGLAITYALDVIDMLNWLLRITADLETNSVTFERILVNIYFTLLNMFFKKNILSIM